MWQFLFLFYCFFFVQRVYLIKWKQNQNKFKGNFFICARLPWAHKQKQQQMIAKNLRICIKFIVLHISLSLSMLVFVSCSCVRQLFRIWFQFECGCQAAQKIPKLLLFYCGLLFYCVCVLLFLCLFLNTHFTFRRRQREIDNFIRNFQSCVFSFFFIVFLVNLVYKTHDMWHVVCDDITNTLEKFSEGEESIYMHI